MKDTKEKVKQATDIVDLIGEFVELKRSGKTWTGKCPFHEEKTPGGAFHVYRETQTFKCFSCGEGGDVIEFIQVYKKKTFLEGLEYLANRAGMSIPSSRSHNSTYKQKNNKQPAAAPTMEGQIEKYTEGLSDDVMQFLKEARGLKVETILKYKIGWVQSHPEFEGKERITIPVFRNKKCINIRFHSLKDEKPKDYPFTRDLPYATYLFPEDQLNNDEIWLCEGELDTLCAISHGLPAITVTGGAGSWKDEFSVLLKNKRINIVYDCDEAGKKGAEKIAAILNKTTIKVKVINLGLEEGEDITDWFVEYEKSKEELEALAKKTSIYEKKPPRESKTRKPSKQGFNPRPYSKKILNTYHLKFDKYKRFWIYNEKTGIWQDEAEIYLNSILRKEILGSDDYKRYCVGEIVADLQGLTYINEAPEEPKAYLIPFNNKIYDLKDDKFLDYTPNFFFINKLAVNINEENQECPKIDKIFSEIVSPLDIITLYEIFAYSLWRSYPYPKIFILYGSGGNGKGVYIKILNKIFGKENMSLISSSDLQNNRFASSQLFGKLLNVSGEMEYNILKKTTKLKQSCGEDLIYCERKFREPFPFTNYAKMIFLTNQVPLTMDKTFAFYRRIFLLEFPNKFIVGENADPMIVEKLPEEEFEGLAWKSLITLKGLYENNFVFTNHEKTEEVTKKYEDLSNPLVKFLEEFTKTEPDGDIPIRDFFEKYISYLEERGLRIWTNREVNKVMKDKGYNQKALRGSNGTYKAWLELKWK